MATITKRKDSWFVQIRRKGFTSRYKSFASKSEAQSWAREQETKIDSRSASRATNEELKASVSSLLNRYIEEITITKRSASSERLRLRKMQDHRIADLRLSELTAAAVAAYRDDRLRQVKPGTVRRELSLLSNMLDVAQKQWGLGIGPNPVAQIRLPAADDRRDRRLNDVEMQRLEIALSNTRNPLIEPIVKFAIETAMRRGEILALSWEHIDLERGTAHIPKTKTGNPRTIALTPGAIAIVSALERKGERPFPVHYEALKSAWQRICRSADLENFRFHDLRHEAISRFCELGLSIAEVAAISGHRDPRMLFRYAHIEAQKLSKKILNITQSSS